MIGHTVAVQRVVAAVVVVLSAAGCGGSGSDDRLREEIVDTLVDSRGLRRACVAEAVDNIDRSHLQAVADLAASRPVDATLPPDVLEALAAAYQC